MDTTREVGRLRERGLLTSGTVARMLGIKLNTLRGLEGKLFEPVLRESKRGYRLFTAGQVERIREALHKQTSLDGVRSRKSSALVRETGQPLESSGSSPAR